MSCQHFPSMGSDPIETDPIETHSPLRFASPRPSISTSSLSSSSPRLAHFTHSPTQVINCISFKYGVFID